MSLQNTQRIAQYIGNGAAASFAIPFVFHANTHVKIWKETISTGAVSLLTLTTDYSLSGLSNPAGGTATLVSVPTADNRITIARVVPYEQLVDYINNARLDADTHERQMDLIVMQVQQLADPSNLYGNKSIKFPITELLASPSVLPAAIERKGKIISFDPTTGDMSLITMEQLHTNLLPYL